MEVIILTVRVNHDMILYLKSKSKENESQMHVRNRKENKSQRLYKAFKIDQITFIHERLLF